MASLYNPAPDADYDVPPDLLWPAPLVDRPLTPKVAYLDQNYWINFAKAAAGHPGGARYLEAWEACQAARNDGAAIFPISDTHYVELSKIPNPRQRADVASVMEALSGFTTILAKPTIMRLELDVALAGLLGEDRVLLPGLPLLGSGIFWAFGRVGLRFHDGTTDTTDFIRKAVPNVYENVHSRFERAMLRGPQDHELDDLRARGWIADAGTLVAERRAQQEREQAARFNLDTAWRTGRLRDVILARELLVELFDMLNEALSVRGRTFAELNLDTDRSRARQLVRSMPSSELSVELKRAAHRNPQLGWSSNDMFDIDAMSLAVPYCDIVATERRACHALRAAHLDRRMGTVVVATPADLIAALGVKSVGQGPAGTA